MILPQLIWKSSNELFMLNIIETAGFTVWSIDRGFTDMRNGRTLQCDIVFFRI